MAPQKVRYKNIKELNELTEGASIEEIFNAVEKYLIRKGRPDLVSPDYRRIILTWTDYYKKESKTDFQVIQQLITIAEDELTSAKLLHKNKQYAKSTYLLQQASEKNAKAWCLYYGYIKVSDLKHISHRTPKAFLKALKSRAGDFALKIIKLSNNKYNPEINKLEETIYKMGDIARIEYDTIITMLEAGKTLELLLEKELNSYTNLVPKKNLKELSNFTMAFVWAYIIAIITFPHEESTRYPNTEGRINALNPTDYTLELGVVKATPSIIPYLQKSIQALIKLHDRCIKNNNVITKEH